MLAEYFSQETFRTAATGKRYDIVG